MDLQRACLIKPQTSPQNPTISGLIKTWVAAENEAQVSSVCHLGVAMMDACEDKELDEAHCQSHYSTRNTTICNGMTGSS
jgi:hypothetical protein